MSLLFVRLRHDPLTTEGRKDLERRVLGREGRGNLIDHHCLDCNGWDGLCEWCKGGAFRRQRRLHDELHHDLRERLESPESGRYLW